jgi:23S rRNA pseudouridine1911/1915/1917 synthase
VLTVPAGSGRGGSLVERLLAAEPPQARRRGLWVVHRIDRWVSGLVVVARRPEALAHLRAQFARRTVLREYLALVEGKPPAPAGRLVSWLTEHPKTRKVTAGGQPGRGKEAVLHYETREALPHASLVACRLETGRRNQIRVQMAETGCPLVGDEAFGRPSPLIRRVALHATRLRFRHPGTGAAAEFISEPPADFRAALERLRRGALPAGQAPRRP